MGTFQNLFVGLICIQFFCSTICQVLNPPLFNLAENKKITATATCGELNGRPLKEMFCFLAGATAYNPFIGLYTYSSEQDQYFAELRIGGNHDRSDQKNVVEGGQNCEFCDSSDPDLRHPAEYMVDGTPRWWQSPPLSRGMEYNQVNITLDLEQEFHVAYVSITMANSPRPGLWVLERSTDYGKTYRPWQYFAENPSQCEEFFGPDALQPILDDDNVVCSTEYSQIVPLENGEIIITLLNNRPSRGNFSHSEKLQKFTQATNVRIRLLRAKTLQGHLMDLNDKKDPSITRRYFYAIKEIEMGGRCVCNGHAKTCDILDQHRSDRLLCRCEHNTCGDQCDKCCPGFEQKQWQPTREGNVFECEPCNCFGHSEDCEYDKSVDEQRLSLDIKGNAVGGGVCKNCRDNTAGINCNKCVFGYYRPDNRPLNASDACQPCRCSPYYHTGACDERGDCECLPKYESPDCRNCAAGYYDYPECKPCDCNVNGTSGGVCLPENGECPCKPSYTGTFCDQCKDGTYKFPDCIECQCDDRGASDKNCSKTSGHCNCKLNYGGKSCEFCADGYYGYPSCSSYCHHCDPRGTDKEICDKTNGKCICKPGIFGDLCDQCDATFYGYPDCKPCLCDLLGSSSESCHTSPTGQCTCKRNFTGRRCNKCSAGYYDYPQCLPCDCDGSGSRGITCDDNGSCYCKPNFDGTKCNRCKANFYNPPICEECNCDPRGVSSTFLGCDKAPKGELCSCKERVTGRICNECKPTFWNLQYFTQLGCDDCGCHLPGTLSNLSDCDDVSGQCQCKAHVSGRNCTDCKTGYFNLQSLNQFGCQPCSCDIGGSYSAICDAKTGQCLCKSRINGRNCTGPIDMHYFPTLIHMQFEAEDGRTVDNSEIRFAIDSELFPNFSWRGFAVFSPIQDEIILDIDITKPTLYRLVLRYVNPTANDVTATAEFVPTYSHNQDDIKQTVQFKLPSTKEPKTFVLSKNGSPHPFVLNTGRWALHIKTQQRLYLDYVALFPAAYYEGSVLRQDVRNPCHLGQTSGSCKHYVYPTIDHPRTTIGGMYVKDNGAKKAIQTHFNEEVVQKHGQVALLEGNSTYVAEIGLMKPGNYVIVIDYANFVADVFPAQIEIHDQGTMFTGSVSFHHCPYGEFCRELVVQRDGQILNAFLTGNGTTVSIVPSSQTNLALGGVVAVPFDEWRIDYLIPKTHCIRRNSKCHGSDFLYPPNSLRFDIETHANQNLSIFAENLPFEVADDKMAAVVLNSDQGKEACSFLGFTYRLADENDGGVSRRIAQENYGQRPTITVLKFAPSVEVNGKVTSPGSYVFVVHYYNPKFASFDVEALVQNERLYKTSNISFANAIIPISFCPSVSGCRTIIYRKEDNAKSFKVNDQFTVTLFLKNLNQSVYADYILTVPLDNYGEDVLEPISGERSAEFLTKCSNLLLETNPEKFDAYCKNRVFSLTADYNMGAFSCDCNVDGSTSVKCESFGGQCPCKLNIIGRQCSMCRPGFYGFPDCKPCKCLRQQQCDPHDGRCFCPLHVEGQQCDVCKPYAFGYDPLIGCQECGCDTQGTIDRTLDCDQLSGQCKCTEKVGGRKCDKCLAGFYGFPYCYKCYCELAGSSPEICDQNNAQCSCKENVRGQSCGSCTYGTFHLEERNPKGCTDCFCFGVTNQCISSQFVKYSISDMRGWTVINADIPDLTEVQSGVEFTASGDGIGPIAPNKAIYFVAPSVYLGKLLYSYGGKLTYIIASHPADDNSYRATAPDVILKGHNETLEYWSEEIPADPKEDFHMSVDLLPERWRREGGSFVSRPLFMMVLNRVSAIYLKASYFDRISKASVSRVFLDSATEDRNRVGEHALNVESCYCPPGYSGSSCEECSDGYYRVQGHSSGSSLGSCLPCQCNGHSSSCDKITGQCFDCQHNTVGEHCELCSVGFHGDPTRGHPSDCQLCACPHPTLENNFATSCSVAESGHVKSCHCKPGYAGRNCERCDIGFFGDPMQYAGKCQPCFCNENNNLTIPAACDPYSGVCSLCERNTMGIQCETCATWYYGDAVNQKNCRDCSCNKCNSYLCEHDTGVCRCKPNVEGENCDRCVANGWDFKSCHGCRMCNCGLASTSTQCDPESGKCSCQPGASGQYCDECEQGYWNYNEHGCKKCDCEADLSLGTVCDVQTGHCHCMAGATGPRCDQCIEEYLRLPEHGCRFCDRCVHVLVDDLDNLQVDIYKAENDLGSVSTVYLTSQRLSRINNTLASLKPSAEEMKKASEDSTLTVLKTNVGNLNSTANENSIKSYRHKDAANKTEQNAKNLETSGLELQNNIDKIISDVHNLVHSLKNLAANMGRQAITTERRDKFLNDAREVLEKMKQVDFSSLEQSAKAKHTEAEQALKTSLEKAKSFMDDKEKSKKLLKTLENFEEKLQEHRGTIAESRDKADMSEVLNSRIKADPFFNNGLNVDQKLDVCNENIKAAKELAEKTRTLKQDIDNAYTELGGMVLNNSSKLLEEKANNFDDELPTLQRLQEETNRKIQQFELSARNLVHQFSGVKADSHKAVQAAESHDNIAKSIKDAEIGSTDASSKSLEANSNSLGIQDRAKNSSVHSHALQVEALNRGNIVTNELTKGIEKAKSSVNAINETVLKNLATVEQAAANYDKQKSARQDNADTVISDAKELQTTLKQTNEKIAEIAGKLPELQEKVTKSVRSSTNATANMNLASTQIKNLESAVPNAIASVSSYTKKLNSLETALRNVTAMVDDLRNKLAKARDLANRVKIGAHFYENSSLQLQNPDKLTRTSAYSLISLYFKTAKREGLLLFLGNEQGTARTLGVPTDDYMALEIRNGKVTLTYDLGSGEASITSNRFVSNGEWHKATIERTGNLATLTVEGEGLVVDKSEGFSMGSKSVLNLHQDLSKFYIGGVPDRAKMPHGVRNRNFSGQIEEVYFHGQPLGLWNFALNGRVDTYGARERTELQRDITDTGVRLNGEGYVEMQRGSWVPRKETKIMLSFKTFASNGMLFYVGKERDYLSIEMRGGKIYAHYNLGSGSANLTTPNVYNDGEWHNVEFDRVGKDAKLIMDIKAENVIETTAPGNLADLDVTDVYYIGGLKHNVPQRDVTNQSFYGCIDKLKLNSQIMPNLNHHSSAAFVEVGCPEKPIRLVSFESSPGSVQFSPLSVSTKIEVTFKFKSHLKDALLLLIADESQITTFAVTLESGTLVVTTITNGQGTLSRLKMEYKDFADGSWHYVTALRDDKIMQLHVDDMFSETGELNAVGLLSQTDVVLYFGKIPADKVINPQLPDRVVQPFVGCIGDVTFNRKLLDFSNATRTKTGVSLVGCPMADIVPSTSEAGEHDESVYLVLENATSLKAWRPTPSPLDSCALDFGVPPTLSSADAQGSRFGLEPFSRLEFDKLPDTFDTKGEFSIQFRASAANGILFYATNEKRTDFISLYMKNGYLVFSFDSGSGPTSIQTKRRYLDYHWHTAVAWREGKSASITVDGIVENRGESSGTTFAVDTHRPFYVGGLPQELVPFSKKTVGGVSPVFGGCLRDFKLNNVELTEPAVLHGVKPCSETMENGLYFGPNGGYAILQEQFNVGTTFSFEMEMKPRVKDAILLSITASGSKGDYLTLQMIDGNMKFIVDNGDGPQMVNLSLVQSNSICDGHWHSVKIYKTKNLLTMSVDGFSKFFVIKVKATETNTKDSLYLGGIPPGSRNRGLETNENFYGCVRGVIVGKKPRRKKDLEMKDIKVHGDVRYGAFCPVS